MQRLLSTLLLFGSLCGVTSSVAADSEHRASASSVPTVSKSAQMLLKLGDLRTNPELERLTGALESASRQALGELPGVRLLDAEEDAAAAVKKRKPPVVLITGKLVELGQKNEGKEVLISAKVEYFVHRLPGESIAAVVSGAASARVAPVQMQKRPLRERLERSLIAAAVESAVKRTPPALKAAVK